MIEVDIVTCEGKHIVDKFTLKGLSKIVKDHHEWRSDDSAPEALAS